ncbi:UDP-2,3-diacylglucosamine diphosphatase [candidate division KSB1 bacterium]|nr:UDP-2,3-diacylglucosamine diphosphatase [candidate division KSB1 bacterium]
MEKILLISDAHLGSASEKIEKQRRERLVSFLRYVETHADRLVICGDLFDFWFEYDTVILRDHFRVLCELLRLTQAGVRVDYLAGNHDFWLGTFLQEIGVQIHADDWVLQSEGRRIYLCHGDGLLRNDYLYRLLKRVLRNRLNIRLYRLLHPDCGVRLALFFSRLSRMTGKDRADYTDIDYRRFAYEKIKEGYDCVVLGHTHWPALDNYAGGWYLNPGPWMTDFTFIEITAEGPALYCWDGDRPLSYKPVLPPGFAGQVEHSLS